MKMKKKTAMIVSLAVGTMLFATTALAEVTAKSGYEQLKDGIKYTTDSCANKLQSYTLNFSVVLKDNGNIIRTQETLNKYDVSKNAMENTSTESKGSNGKSSSYYYSDKTCSISYDSNQNTYYERDFNNTDIKRSFTDPFKEKQAADIEKIADALVGNLKDYVVVKQNADGTRDLSGSLTEAQIPALVNAVASYQIKNAFGGYRSVRAGINDETNMPKITQDVFVKEIKGNMTLSKEGLIQSVLGSGTISGKDDAGKEHNLSVEILCKITDVNTTVVNKPDLSGKKVEKSTERNDRQTNPEMLVGKYKNDIVIVKDGKFQKIGERFVQIAHADNSGIAGRYYEEYLKGYEDYAANKKDFTFDAKFRGNDKFNASFDVKDSSGKSFEGDISTPPSSAEIYFYINSGSRNRMNSDHFSRVFD